MKPQLNFSKVMDMTTNSPFSSSASVSTSGATDSMLSDSDFEFDSSTYGSFPIFDVNDHNPTSNSATDSNASKDELIYDYNEDPLKKLQSSPNEEVRKKLRRRIINLYDRENSKSDKKRDVLEIMALMNKKVDLIQHESSKDYYNQIIQSLNLSDQTTSDDDCGDEYHSDNSKLSVKSLNPSISIEAPNSTA